MSENTSVRLCTQKDFPEAEKLWSQCFDDEPEYVDFIYRQCKNDIVIIGAFENNALVGLSHLFPTKIITESMPINAFYGYAICVREDRRGKGIFELLHRFVMDYVSDTLYFIKPANKKLCQYYQHFGFKEINHFAYLRTDLWQEDFYSTGHLNWSKALSQAAEKEMFMTGGCAKNIIVNKKKYYFTSAEVDSSIVITSRIENKEVQTRIAQALKADFPHKEILVQHNGDFSMDGGVILACNCPEKTDFSKIHFNLIFV